MSLKAVFCLSLHQDYLACSSDLQEVLQQDPNVQEAEKELEEVTVLLRQSLANTSASPAKARKTVPITEVGTPLYLDFLMNLMASSQIMYTADLESGIVFFHKFAQNRHTHC